MKPDVITVNPYSIDYPFWRWEMETLKDKFGRIINGFYNDHRKYNFKDFIVENTPWAISIDAGEAEGDWRSWTINKCLYVSVSEWVLFLEQDFVPGEGFWQVIEDAKDYDIAGFAGNDHDDLNTWKLGERLHPAFLLVKREFLDRTHLDFGAHPENGLDHFGTLTDELFKMNPKFLDIKKYLWKHYSGVYYDYMLVQQNKELDSPHIKNTATKEEFKEFVEISMQVPVKQDPRFIEWSKEI